MNWQKRQHRSEGFVAASPRKFTEQSKVLRSETGLTVLCGRAHYRSLSLELACLLDSLWGRPRMTESSLMENQSHPVISKDMLRLHLSYSEKFIFFSTSLFLRTFLSSVLSSATYQILLVYVKVERCFGDGVAFTGEFLPFYEVLTTHL